MSAGKEIKDKIKSVKNTGKITRAMELISTVKMKKAQDAVLSARPFAESAIRIMSHISDSIKDSPFCQSPKEPQKKKLVVLVTSNRGLCGGYNVNLFRSLAEQKERYDGTIDYVTVGKKAREFITRTGETLIADFSDIFGDLIELNETKKLSSELKNLYLSGDYDEVQVIYSYYVSAISQKPVYRDLYPMQQEKMVGFLEHIIGESIGTSESLEYDIEPNKEAIIDQVIPMILDVMFYEMLLEAKASEHAARMVAMKNASENAGERAKLYTLQYNKARQASITKEVSEIVSGVESMKEV